MTRVAVSGCQGFIGQALMRQLSLQGHHVIGLTRQLDRFEETPANWVAGDYWQVSAEQLTGVEVFIHCAARVHHTQAFAEEIYQQDNAALTQYLAQVAAIAGVKRFIFLSSIKVNGEATQTGQPFRIQDSASPADAYGRSKWCAEQSLVKVCQQHSMEWLILRLPLIYGPGARANLAQLMDWILKGYPLPFGKVENRRSLLGLSNLIDLISRCLDNPILSNKLFLVSDGEDLSTPELIRFLSAGLQAPYRVWSVPVPFLEHFARAFGQHARMNRLLGNLQVESSPLFEALHWKPPVSVEAGLKDMAHAFLQAHQKTR